MRSAIFSWLFAGWARTIGQREAVLRAQNEAVGALNRRVEAVLNTTNDAIMMLDRGGGFSVVNARFAQLFGIEPDVLLDHTFSQAGPLLLSRFRDKDAVRRLFSEVISDPDAVCDETLDIIDPIQRTLRFYSAPVRGSEDSNLLGRIFVFRDVTRESAVDRMKTEFVSTVSHELRTPLTAIKGYVDLMVSGQTGPVSEIQQEFLGLVQASTRRLSALINDMLDVSRIESGRIALRQESVDYVPLVQQTVRMMQNEAEKKQITVSVEIVGADSADNVILPPVIGDSDRITQVLVT
jgi:signal transduction histidine kinase